MTFPRYIVAIAAACLAISLGATSRAASPNSAAEAPVYQLSVRMDVDPERNHGEARGTMIVNGWKPGADGRRCLYLPYNDPIYEFDPIRDFDLIPRKYTKIERAPGQQEVKIQTPSGELVPLSPYVFELRGLAPTAGFTLEFKTNLPRWHDADPDEWLFTDFHPQPLSSCPTIPDDSRTFSLVPNARITARLQKAPEWQLASPGLSVGAQPANAARASDVEEYDLNFEGRKLVVAMIRGFRHWVMPFPNTSVEIFYRDPGFEKLIPAMQNALSVQSDMFGLPPFPHMIILETTDVEKSSLPGVLAVNRPKQAGLASLQDDVLNWTDWQVTSFVAEQWFGASMTIGTLDDLWLLRGLVDFATIESLYNTPKKFTLLKPDDDDTDVNFDYRQTQDLLAAVLTYLHPYNTLTDQNYVSLEPFSKQHSLSYVRHALALRQINWTLGRKTFRNMLRHFVTDHRGQTITPKTFAEFYEAEVQKLPLSQRESALSYLRQWWASDEWPDFELMNVDSDEKPNGAGYATKVHIRQSNGFILPVSVTVTDDNGRKYAAPAKPSDEDPNEWIAELDTETKPDEVELDRSHQVFDWNRFNNRNVFPDVNFFPGGATTFADDAYTVLWLPLATQLPGEPLTLQVVAQGFRYMHSSFTGIASYVPQTHRPGYSLYYLTDFPKLGSYMVADAIQDKGLSFGNERVIDIGMYKTLSLIKDPSIEYGIRLRNREVLNNARSRHQTAAFKAQVMPLNQYGNCLYSSKLELEKTVHSESERYDYNRDFVIGEGTCKVVQNLELGLRGFSGALEHKGRVSNNVRFYPQDINEARLRFDAPTLQQVQRINTYGADVLVPAALPIPDAFFALKRQTRWRLFYDYGQSQKPDKIYRDAGVGMFIPFGGDLVGKGSVSLLNFSALVVLYREAGTYRSRAPGLLFDFDFFGKI